MKEIERVIPSSNGRSREKDILTEERPTTRLIIDPQAAVEDSVYQILLNVGENPERDGLVRTPHRVAKMYSELLQGYEQDVRTIINGAMFEVEYGEGEMVVVSDIEYSSMCEHHMLPFVGVAHVAYLPGEKVVGLSKIPRIVDMFSRRLQVQERLTNQIASAIQKYLDPLGVAVVIRAYHLCMMMRGVQKQN